MPTRAGVCISVVSRLILAGDSAGWGSTSLSSCGKAFSQHWHARSFRKIFYSLSTSEWTRSLQALNVFLKKIAWLFFLLQNKTSSEFSSCRKWLFSFFIKTWITRKRILKFPGRQKFWVWPTLFTFHTPASAAAEAEKLQRITFITAHFIHFRTTSFCAMTERKGLYQKVSDQVANDFMIKHMSNGSTWNLNGYPYFWHCFIPFEHWSLYA